MISSAVMDHDMHFAPNSFLVSETKARIWSALYICPDLKVAQVMLSFVCYELHRDDSSSLHYSHTRRVNNN